MPAKDTRCPRLAILIVAAQPLVAQDIALTIVDEMPDAQVIIAESIDAGMQAIAPFAAIAIALVELEEAAFSDTALMPALTDKGARICLIGARSGQRWPTLPTPFSTDDLLSVLKTLAPPP